MLLPNPDEPIRPNFIQLITPGIQKKGRRTCIDVPKPLDRYFHSTDDINFPTSNFFSTTDLNRHSATWSPHLKPTTCPEVTPRQLLLYLDSYALQTNLETCTILDLRESRLFQRGRILTAVSANCQSKLMARKNLLSWLRKQLKQPSFPSSTNQKWIWLDSRQSELSLNLSQSVVVYDQTSLKPPDMDQTNNSPQQFFIQRLIEAGNKVFLLKDGFEAFRQLPGSERYIQMANAVMPLHDTTGHSIPVALRRHESSDFMQPLLVKNSPVDLPSNCPPCLGSSFNLNPPDLNRSTAGMNCRKNHTRNSTKIKRHRKSSEEGTEDVFSAQISKILPFLYLGNARDSGNIDLLNSVGITHIINATGNLPNVFEANPRFEYLRIPTNDSNNEDIRQYFERSINFIESARKSNGRVLIHCLAGVSRSTSFVLAYIIAHSDFSVMKAFEWVQKTRPIIGPNFHFLGQLEYFRLNGRKEACSRPRSQTVQRFFSEPQTLQPLTSLPTPISCSQRR